MGKVLTDEDIKLNIIINGNEAQKELNDLEKSTRKLTEENKGLLLQKKLLEKQGKKNSEEYKALTATIRENGIAISQNKTKMSDLQKQIGITGLTMSQLSQKAHTLKMSLLNAVPGGDAYNKYKAELDQVNARLSELRGNANNAGISIGSIADKFNRYAALGASVLGFLAGMVVSVQKIIDLNGKLSDAQANVMKTTGMTKVEVDELTKSFGILKTRTGRIELLGIAEVGGRLGIAKTEINDFVKVMDKAGVALGDSFEGGPEVVADKLGKIKGLYDDLKNASVETAFESVGSALNDLGASGTASEQNVAEFVTRVGAMPEAFKPSIGTALGLGAAFEESGLKAEVAAGNYSKVISIAANNAAGFAQVMGKSKKEVEDLLKTNPNEFFLQFAESLKGMNAIDLAKTLDALKLNDNEVKMVLGAASKNTDLFREKIDLANRSLIDATSLTKEFDIKNATLGATLEKIKKDVSGWFSSEGFVAFLQSAVNWFAKFVGAVDDTEGNVTAFRNTLVFTAKIIAIVTAAFLTNVAWQKLVVAWTNRNTEATVLYNIASKARAVAEAIGIIATQGFAAAQMFLAGNITGATQALRVMNTVLKTTPWGFILGAVAAIVVAYQAFKTEADSVSKVQQTLNDVHLEAEKSIISQKKEIELLAKAARDESLSQGEREKALLRLNEIIPNHIGILTLQNIKTMEGKSILDAYTESIYKNARALAAKSRFEELAKEKLVIEKKTGGQSDDSFFKGVDRFLGNTSDELSNFKTKEEVSNFVIKNFADYIELKTNGNKNTFNREKFRELFDRFYIQSGLKEKYNQIGDIDAQMKALEPELLTAAVNNDKNGNPIVPGTPTSKPTTTPKAKKEKYDDSYLADEKKRKDELYQAEKKAEEDIIALLKDGYNKELRLEILRHQDKLHQFEGTNQNLIELETKLQKDLIIAQKSGDNTKVASIKNQLGLIKDERVFINKQIESAEQLHHIKIGTIQEKAATEEIKTIHDQYELEKQARETAFLNELAELNLTEEEKKLRKEAFAKAELQRELDYLVDQAEIIKKAITETDVNGIQFNLLTEDQKDKLAEDLEKILNAIAKIKDAKGGDKEKGKEEIDLGLGGDKPDILGFTTEQWANFYRNIDQGTAGIQTMMMAVGALKNNFAEFDKLASQSEAVKLKQYEKNADARKKSLKKQLDAGIINQDQYNKRVELIDKDLDNKKADIEYKQAKRQKTAAIAKTIIDTATSIMQLWTNPGFPMAIPLSVLVGTMGAVQLATIAKTPLPSRGAEEGYYPNLVRREQDNKLFRTTGTSKMQTGLFSKPRLLVGEGPGDMPEMVIDKKAFAQISPETKAALLREISTVKGFENGYYNKDTFYTGTPNTTSQSNTNDDVVSLLKMALTVVAQNTEVMNDIKENGMAAYVSNKDFKSMKNLQKGMKEYNELISNSKVS